MAKDLVAFSLQEFKNKFGQCKYAPNCENSETGDKFAALVFSKNFADKDEKLVFVYFSKALEGITPKEIAEKKDQLQVIEATSAAGNTAWYLSNVGEGSWEDVEL